MCKNPLPSGGEKLTTDFSDLKQKKTYRGFARMNADQEE